MRSLLIICLFVISIYAYSRPVRISGQTANAAGHTLRVYTYSDMITNEKLFVNSTIVDHKGAFSLGFDVGETGAYIIDVAGYQGGIYLEPGGRYQILIDSLNLSDPLAYFSRLNSRFLSYSFINDDPSDINIRINIFYLSLDSFIVTNFSDANNRRNVLYFDSLITMINSRFGRDTSVFFQKTIEYNLAQLEYVFRLNRDIRVFHKYIYNRDVFLRHPAYMMFFNEYFDSFILQRERRFTISDLKMAIMVQKSYRALTDVLFKDTLLKNQYLLDIVLIKSLGDLYNNREFSNSDIIEVLRQASQQSPYIENRRVAGNMIRKLSRYSSGSPAPEFRLSTHEGDSISLSDYRGKYVLLAFLNSSQFASQQEALLMAPWSARYRRSLQIISVNIDEFSIHTQDFVSQSKPGWILCTAAISDDVVRDYKLLSFPFFVLIDPAGYYIRYPAPKPSEDFEGYFKQLTNVR